MSKLHVYDIANSNTKGQTVDTDEAAYYEPPDLDLRCLEIQQFPVLFKDYYGTYRVGVVCVKFVVKRVEFCCLHGRHGSQT